MKQHKKASDRQILQRLEQRVESSSLTPGQKAIGMRYARVIATAKPSVLESQLAIV